MVAARFGEIGPGRPIVAALVDDLEGGSEPPGRAVVGEIVAAIARPDMKERLATLGYAPVASTPAQAAAQFSTEMAKWTKVIRAAGIKAQ